MDSTAAPVSVITISVGRKMQEMVSVKDKKDWETFELFLKLRKQYKQERISISSLGTEQQIQFLCFPFCLHELMNLNASHITRSSIMLAA